MMELAITLIGIVALLAVAAAWDIGRRRTRVGDYGERIERLEAAHEATQERMRKLKERNDAQVKNALQEVRELLSEHDHKTSGAIAAMTGRHRRMGA